MGVHGRAVASTDARVQHPDPVVLEQQRVMVGRRDQRIQVSSDGAA